MRALVLTLFLPAFSLLFPSALWASATTSLVEKLKAVVSIQGRFEQTVLDQGGTRLQEASGKMTLASGNRFYWHTQSPFEQLAISDGSTLWVYDADLEQVVIRPMSAQVSNTPALLFSGDPEKVAQVFSVEQVDALGTSVTYRLTPLGDDPLFELLEVTFVAERPDSMRLEDALGQQTSIFFRDVELNTTLDANLFSFVPPDGTDVIRQAE